MFRTDRSWRFTALAGALFFAILIQVPQFLYMQDARWKGIPVQLNSDEYLYLARVEEALTSRPWQASEAFIGDPTIVGSQPALLEQLVGIVFWPTGWRAATVLQVMDSVTCFLLFLSLLFFFRSSGFSRSLSLLGTVLFFLIELYNLNRPIRMGLSFVLLLFAWNAVLLARRGNIRSTFVLFGRTMVDKWSIIGGIFLGLLFGDAFFSWTAGILFLGLLFLWDIINAWKVGGWKEVKVSIAVRHLLLASAIGAVVALPFLWNIYTLTQSPFFADLQSRTDIFFSHFPESWPYSILFAVMSISAVVFLIRSREAPQYAPAVLLIITGFLLLNQQFVHGVILVFSSHYIFVLALGALCMLLLFISQKRIELFIGALAALIYLGALAYDGRYVLQQFHVIDRFEDQHLASLLPVLDALPRTTILTDADTSLFIAGSTPHNVVYSLYMHHFAVSTRNIAGRFCATLLPLRPLDRHLDEQVIAQPGLINRNKDNAELQQKKMAMVRAACAAEDSDPEGTLELYHVRRILWNEKRQPQWDLKRLHVPLTKVASGEGWSLWQVAETSK